MDCADTGTVYYMYIHVLGVQLLSVVLFPLTASAKELSQKMVASAAGCWVTWTITTTGRDWHCEGEKTEREGGEQVQ